MTHFSVHHFSVFVFIYFFSALFASLRFVSAFRFRCASAALGSVWFRFVCIRGFLPLLVSLRLCCCFSRMYFLNGPLRAFQMTYFSVHDFSVFVFACFFFALFASLDRKSTRLNSSH